MFLVALVLLPRYSGRLFWIIVNNQTESTGFVLHFLFRLFEFDFDDSYGNLMVKNIVCLLIFWVAASIGFVSIFLSFSLQMYEELRLILMNI